ncbi:MAG: hypothetical protein K6E18_00910 [Lachnospiraceae bacterium]|nr:hypothetical protein [Lachnospiraceae bacterium]
MKKTELRKRMKRLCSLLLAVILTVSAALPVLADPDTSEEDTTINITSLKPGQILQAEDVITYDRADQTGYQFIYLDYGTDEYAPQLGNESFSSSSKTYQLRPYTSAGLFNKDLSLSPEQFSGWRVVSADYLNSGCSRYHLVVLMAEPQTISANSPVTCYTSLPTVSGITPSVTPDGAGLQLFGYDTNTGKPLETDEKGNLIASPGDVIYACTTPVEGYCSEIAIEMANGNALENCTNLAYWCSIDTAYPYQFIYHDYSVYSFLPKEADCVYVFAMPNIDATVKAVYHYTDAKLAVTYYDKNGNNKYKEDYAPVNSLYTIWNPQPSEIEGQDLNYWQTYNTTYYQKLERIRIKSTLNLKPGTSSSSPFMLTGNSTFRTSFYNVREKRLAPMFEAVTAGEDDEIFLEADPAQVPKGQTITGYKVTVGGTETTLQFPTGLLSTIIEATETVDGGSMSYQRKYSPITGPASITLLYSDETPKDFVIDLSEEDTLLQKPSENGAETDFVWNALAFPNDSINTTYALAFSDLSYIHSDRYFFTSLYSMEQNIRLRFLDLNKDGQWDLSMRANHDAKTISWKVLPGADACEESVYSMTLNREGYGNLVFKLKDRPIKDVIDQKDTDSKEEDKKETGKDEGSKESEKKTEKTEEIAKTPAVGDEIKDEKTGNTYKVTAVGKENTVTLTKAAVKKKTAVIPATVTIGGITYKVTAVDANLLKNQKVTTLELGENIAKIPVGVIKNNKNLKTLKIRNPKKVITLTKKHFKGRKGKLKVYVVKKMFNKYKKMLKAKKITSKVSLKKMKK